MCVCSLSPPRSFDRSSPNLLGVCRWTSKLPLRGSFSKRSTGHFHFHYIIYAPGSRHTAHTAAKRAFCFAATASKSLIRAKDTFCCTASQRVCLTSDIEYVVNNSNSFMHLKLCLVHVQLRTEVPRPPSLAWLGLEIMTSRS